MAKQSKKNFLRLDKHLQNGHLESVVLANGALLAGQFGNLGVVLDSSQGEEVEFTKATAGEGFDVLVAPVYLDRGYTDYEEIYESVPAGKPARAIHIVKGDIISFNSELAPEIKKGDDVEVGADGLGLQKAADGTVVGKCIDINYDSVVGDLAVIRFA